LLVGRVVADDGSSIATIVNYACHPTILAWQNTLLSPDYIGAMRELVERETASAPCLFLQGASGDLAPRWQYTGDFSVADAAGRSLAYAVQATLHLMPPPGQHLVFKGIKQSGAPVAVWEPEEIEPAREISCGQHLLPFTPRETPTEAELSVAWAELDESSRRERLLRARQRADLLPRAEHLAGLPYWIWRLGESVIVAHPGEAYSQLQTELRRLHPRLAIAVMNVTNGAGPIYLPPAELYEQDAYSAWSTVAPAGSLERLVAAIDERLNNDDLPPLAPAAAEATARITRGCS
jgi:hypothetical protein